MVCYLSYLNFPAMLTVSMDVTTLLTSSSPERDDVNKCMPQIPYDLIHIFSDSILLTKLHPDCDSIDSPSAPTAALAWGRLFDMDAKTPQNFNLRLLILECVIC